MKKKQPASTRVMIWTISGLVAMMFLAGALGAVKLMLSDDSGKRKREIRMVTLVKPPPPPKVKEKPPEPKIKKKEEIIEPQEETEPDPVDDPVEDDGPMDNDLGLDADGSGGSDSFGLRAKKGGRSIIGGRYSESSLLRKYAWYTNILQQDLRKKVNTYMEENGGMPDGNLVAHIMIALDESGRVTGLTIERSSGNKRMDKAVREALTTASVSEPPPIGMPRVMKLKISSKG